MFGECLKLENLNNSSWPIVRGSCSLIRLFKLVIPEATFCAVQTCEGVAHTPRKLVWSSLAAAEQRAHSWRASSTKWKENAACTQAWSGQFAGDDVNPAGEVLASSFCLVNKQLQIGFKLMFKWRFLHKCVKELQVLGCGLLYRPGFGITRASPELMTGKVRVSLRKGNSSREIPGGLVR